MVDLGSFFVCHLIKVVDLDHDFYFNVILFIFIDISTLTNKQTPSFSLTRSHFFYDLSLITVIFLLWWSLFFLAVIMFMIKQREEELKVYVKLDFLVVLLSFSCKNFFHFLFLNFINKQKQNKAKQTRRQGKRNGKYVWSSLIALLFFLLVGCEIFIKFINFLLLIIYSCFFFLFY